MELLSTLIKVFVLLFHLTTLMAKSNRYVNIAFHKSVRQKDTSHLQYNVARKAVDGVRLTDSFSCTRTKSRNKAWLVVDLLHIYEIYAIEIINRHKGYQQLTNFYIYVSTVNPLPIPAADRSLTGELCLHHPDTFPRNGPFPLFCNNPVRGRYVYIWKPGNDVLGICEFIVLVNEQKREMGCSMSAEQKTGLASIHWEYIETVSLLHCVNMCLLSPEGSPSIVQLDKRSGKCECIQYSPLLHPSEQITQDQNFDMCRIIDYVSTI